MLEELHWGACHQCQSPWGLVLASCQKPSCSYCSSLPPERKTLPNYLHENWDSASPPAILNGKHYWTWLELQKLAEPSRDAERRALIASATWPHAKLRRCDVPRCFYVCEHQRSMQRHVNLRHKGSKLADCFKEPYGCFFEFPRPRIDGQPAPSLAGSARYCQARFARRCDLKRHRDEMGHAAATDEEASRPRPARPQQRATHFFS